MKDKNRTKQFVLSFFCLVGLFQMVQAQVTPKSLEYWLDTNFAQRSSVATTGSLSQNIDVSTLRPGIHTLAVRVSDTKGRWGAPLLKYFLIAEKSITQNKLTSYEYCFDGNWDASVSGNFDKELSLDISLEGLREGLHHLLLRVTDEEGRISQTVLKNFLVYGEDPKERELTSYKYWIDEFDEAVKGMITLGKDIPLGYIPAGSTNDFAKSIGIASDMTKAAETVIYGEEFPCDVGRFNDSYFVYIAAFGILTEVSYETKQEYKIH